LGERLAILDYLRERQVIPKEGTSLEDLRGIYKKEWLAAHGKTDEPDAAAAKDRIRRLKDRIFRRHGVTLDDSLDEASLQAELQRLEKIKSDKDAQELQAMQDRLNSPEARAEQQNRAAAFDAQEGRNMTILQSNRDGKSATDRISTAQSRLTEMRARVQYIETWMSTNQPQLQIESTRVESLRTQYDAAVARWNQEVASMGPRRTVTTALGSRLVGGPTEATEALVKDLEQRYKTAATAFQSAQANLVQATDELANLKQVIPSWAQELAAAQADLQQAQANLQQAQAAVTTQSNPGISPGASGNSNPASIPAAGLESVQDSIRNLAMNGRLNKLLIIASDGKFLGNCEPTGVDAKSILCSFGTYGQQLGAYGETIWNAYGEYGGKFGLHSATNPFALESPSLLADGVAIGRLTANKSVPNSITVPELVSMLAASVP
jgi:hypothetical protein